MYREGRRRIHSCRASMPGASQTRSFRVRSMGRLKSSLARNLHCRLSGHQRLVGRHVWSYRQHRVSRLPDHGFGNASKHKTTHTGAPVCLEHDHAVSHAGGVSCYLGRRFPCEHNAPAIETRACLQPSWHRCKLCCPIPLPSVGSPQGPSSVRGRRRMAARPREKPSHRAVR